MLARELTKRYETYQLTTVAEGVAYYETTEPRGEYVLVLEMPASVPPGAVNASIRSDAADSLASAPPTALSAGELDPLESIYLTPVQERTALAVQAILEGCTTKDVVHIVQEWERSYGVMTKRNVLYEWIQSIKDYLYKREERQGE
ncbi:MAG TPA: hypothetical protein GX717_04435 [Clostridiaceae bacterium]|nr:hypothetical protein [Clostridiaceae bacterium]